MDLSVASVVASASGTSVFSSYGRTSSFLPSLGLTSATGSDTVAASPSAFAKKEILKVPSSFVFKAIYRHASEESGGEGQPGYEIIGLDDVTS